METVRLEDSSEAVDLVVVSWKVVGLGGFPLKGGRLNDGWLRGDQLGGCWLGCIRRLLAHSTLARSLTAWLPSAQRLSSE